MPARHEQIGQRAGHEQAMRVLLQPAIAHFGKAEHPLDDPDRMLDPGPHFRLGAVFRPLDLIGNIGRWQPRRAWACRPVRSASVLAASSSRATLVWGRALRVSAVAPVALALSAGRENRTSP